MNEEEQVLFKAEQYLGEEGLTLFQLIEISGRYKSKLLQLSDESTAEFCDIYNKITDNRCKKSEKGRLLEELVYLAFYKGYSKLLECRKNCRTSTNEIDLQLNWTEQARLAGICHAFPCFGDSFLCECKNYSTKVNVTYVGKFYSLLKITNSKLGILVTWEGITARNSWSDSLGLIKRIALKDNIYIIPIDKRDLSRISNKETHIFEIIFTKYEALKNDIDYSQYISRHESEQMFIE